MGVRGEAGTAASNPMEKGNVASKQQQLELPGPRDKGGEVVLEASSYQMGQGGEAQESKDEDLESLVTKFLNDRRKESEGKRPRTI